VLSFLKRGFEAKNWPSKIAIDAFMPSCSSPTRRGVSNQESHIPGGLKKIRKILTGMSAPLELRILGDPAECSKEATRITQAQPYVPAVCAQLQQD
jgi:hypothetical protein